ncbi:response regulator [Pseudomonas peradeniyensis]|uniref:Response regulator n=2 Tax=Pseudomonas peradeniyensis TaxID=2745488 RepID=A0ABT2VH63_9PSED|nr:response regulator [Pseudomonas peradeniyensis]MCU7240583.1 response regulator [Pseudomonas peradeniyensis]MCU7282477.1 response regulator [Pseudomonas peradeniyensis]
MRRRVLVVEDDDILRWLMTEAVTHLGHDVIECANADDALEKFSGDQRLALVITDVRMPGHMDGIDLAKAIWAACPELPVIIVSGHMAPAPGFLPANARFISKPCTLDELSRTMNQLLCIQRSGQNGPRTPTGGRP